MTNEEWIKSLNTYELAFVLEDLRGCSICRKNGNSCFPMDIEKWLLMEHKDRKED